MGTMGVPPSVLYNMPVSVCTSNSGFFLMKNSGFPQPARDTWNLKFQKPVLPGLTQAGAVPARHISWQPAATNAAISARQPAARS